MLHCILEENIDFFLAFFQISVMSLFLKKKQDKMWNKVAT